MATHYSNNMDGAPGFFLGGYFSGPKVGYNTVEGQEQLDNV